MDASSPSNWMSYADMRRALAALPQGDHVRYTAGFYLTENTGYWFLDFDDLTSVESQQLVQYFCSAGAAWEYSTSGKGLHVFGRGAVPPHSNTYKLLGLEFYTDKRGIAFGFTEGLQGNVDLDLTPAVAWLVPTYFPPTAHVEVDVDEFDAPCADWNGPTNDVELIERMLRSERIDAAAAFGTAAARATFADLWHGNREAIERTYAGESEADAAMVAAFAFWTGRDAPRTERLMLQSALVRDKWFTQRGPVNYLCYTINNIFAKHLHNGGAVYGQRSNSHSVQLPQVHAEMPQQESAIASPAPQPYQPTQVAAHVVPADKYAAMERHRDAFAAASTHQELEGAIAAAQGDNALDDAARESLAQELKQRYKDVGIEPPRIAHIRAMLAPSVAALAIDDGFERDAENRIVRSQTNVTHAVRLLSRDAPIRFDSFMQRIYIGSRPLVDVDYTRWLMLVERKGVPQPTDRQVKAAVTLVAHECEFDSAQLWLNGLQWDGVQRVEQCLCNVFKLPDTDYHRAVAKYMWSALAGRIIEPGVKADAIPVFISEEEGRNKTSFVEALAPDPQFFGKLSMDGKRDDISRRMRGKMVMEWGELDGLHTRARTAILDFLTQRTEEWVEKYETQTTAYQRRMLIVATSNTPTFLDAYAKERRFLPVDVGAHSADLGYLKEWCTQLWAEAAVRYRSYGVEWLAAYLSAPAEREKYREDDPLEEFVGQFLAAINLQTMQPYANGKFKMSELVAYVVANTPNKRVNQNTVAVILRNKGYSNFYSAGRKFWRKEGSPS